MPSNKHEFILETTDKTKKGFSTAQSGLKRVQGEADKTKKSFDKLQKSTKNADKSMGLLGKTMIGFIAGGALLRLGQGIMNVNIQLEQNEVAFTTMLGSAEEAKIFLEQLSDFAAKTPFQIPDVRQNAKLLMAMGIEVQKVLPTMKALGDVSAGLNVPMSRLALNFGQVKTQGKLTGRELRDFSVAGVPLVAELAKQLGVSKAAIADMVSAGKIGFDEVEQAFVSMTSEGGKFNNLMDAQSKTLGGIFSDIADSFTRLFEKLRTTDLFLGIKESAIGLQLEMDLLTEKTVLFGEEISEVDTKGVGLVAGLTVGFGLLRDLISTGGRMAIETGKQMFGTSKESENAAKNIEILTQKLWERNIKRQAFMTGRTIEEQKKISGVRKSSAVEDAIHQEDLEQLRQDIQDKMLASQVKSLKASTSAKKREIKERMFLEEQANLRAIEGWTELTKVAERYGVELPKEVVPGDTKKKEETPAFSFDIPEIDIPEIEDKAVKSIEKLQEKYVDLEEKVGVSLDKFEQKHSETMGKIKAKIESLKEKLEDLKEGYEKSIGGLDVSIGEKVIEQEQKIQDAKQKMKDASKANSHKDYEEARMLLKREKEALQEFMEGAKGFDDEIADARRRSRLTDFERFIEDAEKKRVELTSQFEEKKLQIEESIAVEQDALAQEQAIYDEKREMYHKVQEKFKVMADSIITGNEKLVDNASKTVEALKKKYAELEKQLLRIKNITAPSGVKDTRTLPQVFAETGVEAPFRAQGGFVQANEPYIVGERGAELFVPKQNGDIVPNRSAGGSVNNVTVNVQVDSVDSRESANTMAERIAEIVLGQTARQIQLQQIA